MLSTTAGLLRISTGQLASRLTASISYTLTPSYLTRERRTFASRKHQDTVSADGFGATGTDSFANDDETVNDLSLFDEEMPNFQEGGIDAVGGEAEDAEDDDGEYEYEDDDDYETDHAALAAQEQTIRDGILGPVYPARDVFEEHFDSTVWPRISRIAEEYEDEATYEYQPLEQWRAEQEAIARVQAAAEAQMQEQADLLKGMQRNATYGVYYLSFQGYEVRMFASWVETVGLLARMIKTIKSSGPVMMPTRTSMVTPITSPHKFKTWTNRRS